MLSKKLFLKECNAGVLKVVSQVVSILSYFKGKKKHTLTSGLTYYLIFILINDDNNPAMSHGKAQKGA